MDIIKYKMIKLAIGDCGATHSPAEAYASDRRQDDWQAECLRGQSPFETLARTRCEF